MRSLIICLIAVAGTASAQVDPQPAGETLLRALPSDTKFPAPVRAFFTPSDAVIPQIATGSDGRGGGFFMIFEIFNLTDRPVDITIFFLDQQGQPMALPLVDSSTDSPGLQGTIPAFGAGFSTTAMRGPVKVGFALIDIPADKGKLQSSLVVTGIFNQVVPGRPVFQASISNSSAVHDRFFVPFLNTGGFTATVAVANIIAQRVNFIARNSAGTELCRSSRLMGQAEQTAVVIRNLLTCSAGLNGVLEVRGERPGLSAVGFLFQDDGAFVTQTVAGQIQTQ